MAPWITRYRKAPLISTQFMSNQTGPPLSWTVAEISTKASELKDKTIFLRGKIVKYNPGIMGKNWVHLRDGSGLSADHTNDLLVTTLNDTKAGEIDTL